MQITVTINETFDNADALAQFASALRQMFAGAVKTRTVPPAALVAVPATPTLDQPQSPMAKPAEADTDDEPATIDAATGDKPKRGRGRPRREDAQPSVPAIETEPAPTGAVAVAVSKIATDAGATIKPAVEAITDQMLRQALAPLFTMPGGVAEWQTYITTVSPARNVAQLTAKMGDESESDTQARIRQCYEWVEAKKAELLAAKATK